MSSSITFDSSSVPKIKSSSGTKPSENKRSIGEKIMSAIFDGPSGTQSSKNERELREKYEEDRLDIPRTEQEEKERQARIRKRADINGGGDGVRTNDMQKGGWGGSALALGHA